MKFTLAHNKCRAELSLLEAGMQNLLGAFGGDEAGNIL